MNVEVTKSFEKDVLKISDKKIANLIGKAIEKFESSKSLTEISGLKKMASKGNYFRLRIAGYRLGFKLDNETIILLRFMDRKDIYKYFP